MWGQDSSYRAVYGLPSESGESRRLSEVLNLGSDETKALLTILSNCLFCQVTIAAIQTIVHRY